MATIQKPEEWKVDLSSFIPCENPNHLQFWAMPYALHPKPHQG